jgi:hypothetical protein
MSIFVVASGNDNNVHQNFLWGSDRTWNIRQVCSLESHLANPEEHSASTERT